MLVKEIVQLSAYKSKKKYKVRLEGGTDFILYKRELSRFEIEEGREISEETYDKLLKEIFIPRARARALYLLEKQDRSENNLRCKLSESGYLPEAIDATITSMKEYHYIDDKRYASNYIRTYSKKKSIYCIKRDLTLKGIDSSIVLDSLDEAQINGELFDEKELIKAFVTKKLGVDFEGDIEAVKSIDKKNIKRIYESLLRKGFCSEDILNVIGTLPKCD